MNDFTRDRFNQKRFQTCQSKRLSYRSNLLYLQFFFVGKQRPLFDKLEKTTELLFAVSWEKNI